ncbi:hypothetical protein FRC08_000160 [Ceratobasidium sp. 394]|nr:hypothetical protein FRC08_000160 [Ceratobasidium sp. 394]
MANLAWSPEAYKFSSVVWFLASIAHLVSLIIANRAIPAISTMRFTSFFVAVVAVPLATWAAPMSGIGLEARQAGTLGSKCGGFIGIPCNEGLYCKLRDNVADGFGICVRGTGN